MRILITGAGGQLGHDLMNVFSGEQLFAFDHAALDIADEREVDERVGEVRPDWIINAAAYTNLDAAEEHADVAYAVNGAGPGFLAAAARKVSAGIVHISTDHVFDGGKGSAYTEDDKPNPLSVYGRSKYEGERRVFASGASACVVRTAWLYGWHGSTFVQSILAAAQKGGPLKVVDDQVGSPTSTLDLARSVTRLVRTPARGLFHAANAGACSRFEFARSIVGDRVQIIPIRTGEAHRRAYRPANSSLASIRWRESGLPPLRPWRDALAEFLAARAVTA